MATFDKLNDLRTRKPQKGGRQGIAKQHETGKDSQRKISSTFG